MTNIKKLAIALLLFSSISTIAQAQSTWRYAQAPTTSAYGDPGTTRLDSLGQDRKDLPSPGDAAPLRDAVPYLQVHTSTSAPAQLRAPTLSIQAARIPPNRY